jgi:hypothetical protein
VSQEEHPIIEPFKLEELTLDVTLVHLFPLFSFLALLNLRQTSWAFYRLVIHFMLRYHLEKLEETPLFSALSAHGKKSFFFQHIENEASLGWAERFILNSTRAGINDITSLRHARIAEFFAEGNAEVEKRIKELNESEITTLRKLLQAKSFNSEFLWRIASFSSDLSLEEAKWFVEVLGSTVLRFLKDEKSDIDVASSILNILPAEMIADRLDAVFKAFFENINNNNLAIRLRARLGLAMNSRLLPPQQFEELFSNLANALKAPVKNELDRYEKILISKILFFTLSKASPLQFDEAISKVKDLWDKSSNVDILMISTAVDEYREVEAPELKNVDIKIYESTNISKDFITKFLEKMNAQKLYAVLSGLYIRLENDFLKKVLKFISKPLVEELIDNLVVPKIRQIKNPDVDLSKESRRTLRIFVPYLSQRMIDTLFPELMEVLSDEKAYAHPEIRHYFEMLKTISSNISVVQAHSVFTLLMDLLDARGLFVVRDLGISEIFALPFSSENISKLYKKLIELLPQEKDFSFGSHQLSFLGALMQKVPSEDIEEKIDFFFESLFLCCQKKMRSNETCSPGDVAMEEKSCKMMCAFSLLKISTETVNILFLKYKRQFDGLVIPDKVLALENLVLLMPRLSSEQLKNLLDDVLLSLPNIKFVGKKELANAQVIFYERVFEILEKFVKDKDSISKIIDALLDIQQVPLKWVQERSWKILATLAPSLSKAHFEKLIPRFSDLSDGGLLRPFCVRLCDLGMDIPEEVSLLIWYPISVYREVRLASMWKDSSQSSSAYVQEEAKEVKPELVSSQQLSQNSNLQVKEDKEEVVPESSPNIRLQR